jgi:DNA primase small subunit
MPTQEETKECLMDGDFPLDHKVDEDARLQYYNMFFPFRQFYQWVNHSPSPRDFSHREIAFTIEKERDSNDTFYLRYQSFETSDEFRKFVLERNPQRFEIGPVFTAKPKDKKLIKKSLFKPVSKELVFDIDLTDYDEVRTCCTDKQICEKCWKFITLAIKILTKALEDDFGFEHILWVYSGRRGAHAWVCDKRARDLTEPQRRAVASYLNIMIKSKDRNINAQRPWHPHISRSFDVLNREFVQTILEEQDPWSTEEGTKKLLSAIHDTEAQRKLRAEFDKVPGMSSVKKWKELDSIAGYSRIYSAKGVKELKQDLILEYMYPRLDINVSNGLIHLLKSPFCIHPSTGRVCVPIDHHRAEEFNPLKAPTVNLLLHQAQEYKNTSETKVKNYEKTWLKPYVEFYQEFVNNLMTAELHTKRQRDESEPSLDF